MNTYNSPITWDQIVNERRVEMAFEETTYWDFFRWGIAVDKLNGTSNPLKAMRIDVTNGTYKYTISNLNRFPGRIRVFDEKEYYFPIPWSEIKYQGITQNPGWTEV
jgi:starch-binding outer membrane protein, SusD/RagB family